MSNYERIDPLKVINKLERRLDETTVALMDFAYGAAGDVCTVYSAGAEITTAVVYFATRSFGWTIAGRLLWLAAVAVVKHARDQEKNKDNAGMPLQ